MYNKCTKNLYLVNVAFDKIKDVYRPEAPRSL